MISTDEVGTDRPKQVNYKLTKLLTLNLRVTWSQVPPSQEETQGAGGTLRFHACPHANSKSSSAFCELGGALR